MITVWIMLILFFVFIADKTPTDPSDKDDSK